LSDEQPLPIVAVWKCTRDLVFALDSHLGEPTDTYVNGSQVWLRDDGPNDVTLEWRLHPVGGYQRPAGTSTTNAFRRVVGWARGDDIGESADAVYPEPEALWGGLEVFSAYDEDLEPDQLRACCVALIGIDPDAVGAVDHSSIGDEWERTAGRSDIVTALLHQLTPS
jgi:hypothetical protein